MHTWIGKILKDEYRKGTNLLDIEISDEPVAVLTYAKMIHELGDFNYTIRPNGRKDYQLLYVKKGYIEYWENDKPTIYGKNTLFLVKPGMPQKRRIVSHDEKFVCFYVHFSGTEVENYLNKYNITESIMKFDEQFDFFEEIINRMEAGRNSTNHCDLCNTLLLELFIHICDKLQQNKFMFKKGFANLLKFMDDTCTENLPVKFYADQIHFSEVYFIRFFKKTMGVSPHKYLMTKKLEKSLPLLLYSKDSIKTISDKLGFSSQHYFSKVFTDKYKISPSDYRNS